MCLTVFTVSTRGRLKGISLLFDQRGQPVTHPSTRVNVLDCHRGCHHDPSTKWAWSMVELGNAQGCASEERTSYHCETQAVLAYVGSVRLRELCWSGHLAHETCPLTSVGVLDLTLSLAWVVDPVMFVAYSRLELFTWYWRAVAT